MELKEFVKETLIQISAGIKDAQEEIRNSGGVVNPAHREKAENTGDSHFGVLPNGQNIFLVDFDVSVTVVEEAETDAKAKLNVASLLTLSAGGDSAKSSKAINNISFKVPLALPTDDVSKEDLAARDEAQIQARREMVQRKKARGSRFGGF
ncbi:hypothetical protein [Thalassotalea mangrovi]|uniref:Uncharacterized protein n=1 Tax=Thalassotalea mangrovi TaxID=2572245 RepID=A0A4U1B2L5_9GAMM|nr:hypothetical protein [Thalassotalea mangrovi]TKB43975.1 hypothetical protein E8M12_13450 [Thalassotalea mangrovi]